MLMQAERDPRYLNHMDPETRRVHARLEEWGRWSRDAEVRPYPAVTLLGRVIEQGISGASQSRPPIAMPDAVAVVDAAIGKLGAIDKRVVQTYYLRWESPEVMARRLQMRLRQFQAVLRRARWRIGGFLDAAES